MLIIEGENTMNHGIMNKTFSLRTQDVQREWFIVDATDKVLGRLATRIATVLRGKHKTTFTPHVDNGDFIVVINAEKIALTGQKAQKKYYTSHSTHPGGYRVRTLEEVRAKHPERIIEQAVRGMLPKNRLGRQMLKKLKIYAGPEHPHSAQQPKDLID